MNAADLKLAERVLAGLSDEAREQAKNLSSRLRLTGTFSTLRWLRVGAAQNGRGELLGRIEAALDIREQHLESLDTPTAMRLQDRASRLSDALHVLARTERRS